MQKKLKDKVKLEWAVLCSQSLVDNQSNNISLFNLIERVQFQGQMKDSSKLFNVEEGEMIPVYMELTSRLRKLVRPSEVIALTYAVDFIDPHGKKLSTFTNEVSLDKSIQNLRVRTGITGLKVTQSGLYNFVVKLKEKKDGTFTEFAKVPLEVILTVQ